jgi:hypothetical protein
VGSPLCIAADDEGNIAVGETTAGITAAMTGGLLGSAHLPTTKSLGGGHAPTYTFATLIQGQLTLAWTEAGASATTPIVVATAAHRFATRGSARLTPSLTAAGRHLFGAATSPVTLTATAIFTTTTGSFSTARRLTFRLPPKQHHK